MKAEAIPNRSHRSVTYCFHPGAAVTDVRCRLNEFRLRKEINQESIPTILNDNLRRLSF
ncbi:hypothetical protein R75461_05952 [Paraburkholderia nemoris]|nr:hypothetical protein R75461_05952 [Paraburkholderia nemoris]